MAQAIRYDDVAVGDSLPPLVLPPLRRGTLALFAGASGDHHPLHIDLDAARAAGLPDVFAHGMLGMAWLGRQITAWAPQARLRSFDVRFAGITQLGHAISCSATVVGKHAQPGEKLVRLQLLATNQHGETKLAGEAVLALP
ncbi:MaoC/PaaZ C-terminal domain-containing protein [Pseudorhodoferax sp.]|uniref:MaoC/PaaZ C-terminal domain-containing protein n=1 Tax=Pseudorhodoferax sp. TaxID=1993553 RepID=UPI002DD68901|nr:MaoC/PaaZ C-terminal domain-containing protein [Pseudorhodoferax sp.]